MAESSAKIVSNNANLQVENNPAEHNLSVEENKTERVMEPMLLEDYKEDNVPCSLQNLLNHFKKEGIALDRNDTLVVFIYILMLETGFVPSDYIAPDVESTCDFHYKRLLLLTNTVPNNWKNNNSYTFSFVLSPFPLYVCSVTCVPVSEDLVINCCIKNIPEANFSVLVDPAMYVVSCGISGGSRSLYQNVADLSQKFKTQISYLCKMFILETHAVRPASLLRLPPEIMCNILKYCDWHTARNLTDSCKYFSVGCRKKSGCGISTFPCRIYSKNVFQ